MSCPRSCSLERQKLELALSLVPESTLSIMTLSFNCPALAECPVVFRVALYPQPHLSWKEV